MRKDYWITLSVKGTEAEAEALRAEIANFVRGQQEGELKIGGPELNEDWLSEDNLSEAERAASAIPANNKAITTGPPDW